jgi:hypothetical protein
MHNLHKKSWRAEKRTKRDSLSGPALNPGPAGHSRAELIKSYKTESYEC